MTWNDSKTVGLWNKCRQKRCYYAEKTGRLSTFNLVRESRVHFVMRWSRIKPHQEHHRPISACPYIQLCFSLALLSGFMIPISVSLDNGGQTYLEFYHVTCNRRHENWEGPEEKGQHCSTDSAWCWFHFVHPIIQAAGTAVHPSDPPISQSLW